MTKIEDVSGSTEMFHDARGNVITETRAIGTQIYATDYAYDAADNLAAITYPSGRIVTYARDLNGRVLSIATRKSAADPEQVLVSGITYLPMGPLDSVTFDNGQVTTYSYDQDYRLTAINTATATIIVQDLDYDYDEAGNVTEIDDNVAPSLDREFDYDDLHRLKRAEGAYDRIDYKYDKVGNRTERDFDDGVTTEELTYASTSNRLLEVDDGGGPTRTLTYTANGNIATDSRGSGFDYLYNDANRLVEVKENTATVATFIYNDLGQRVIQSIPGGSTTHYHYDLDGHLIAESDNSGVNLREYVTLAGLPVAVIDEGATAKFVHVDHLGTPQKMTGVTGAIVWDRRQRPFGETLSITGTATNNQRFPGQYADAATGLHYNWFRHYDPSLGRYITSDPIGLAGGFNTYAYVDGNPVNFTDPEGLQRRSGPPNFITPAARARIVRLNTLLNRIERATGRRPETIGRRDGAPTEEVLRAFERQAAAAEEASSSPNPGNRCVAPFPFRGYTKHGINQAISREGIGVSPQAILDTIRNPVSITQRPGNVTQYKGVNAIVRFNNRTGDVVTVMPLGSRAARGSN